jgi:glycosyltransferase involved in cell wall biosynthesis
MSLSVVHFSTADGEGGSARSAYRLHSGLRRRGHRSRMLVKYKVLDDADIDTVSGSRVLRRCDDLVDRVTWRLGLQYQLVPSATRVLRHPWLEKPDIIQLFNTHGGYFAPWMLPALARRARLVWRLSDMWPMTGHCAYAGACERWRSGCGRCPDLATYPAIGLDTTAMLWRQKKRLYDRTPLTVVAPSSWIEGTARQSPLLARADIHRIPNGLDLTTFHETDQASARAHFAIPQTCTAILFAPHVASDNKRKGGDLLEAALHRLGPREDVVLLVAGVGAEQWVGRVPQTVVPLGYLRESNLMAMANSAADVVVVSSSVENLPNGVLEAFACRRPVVAFDTGGMRDAVRDGETGLLVPALDVEALSSALERMIVDAESRRAMGDRALALARQEFSADVEISRFETLYATLIAKDREI